MDKASPGVYVYDDIIFKEGPIFSGNNIALNSEKSMELLFKANVSIDHNDAAHQVFFDQEKYMFRPDANDKSLPGFSFKREHDEWHEQEPLAPQLKKQSIDALEKYLLAQH